MLPRVTPELRRSSLRSFAGCAFLLLFAASCRNDDVPAAASEPPQIEMKGVLEATQSLTVAAQVEGAVAEIAVREGDLVAAGAPLLSMSNPAVERELEIARAELALAAARAQRSTLGAPAPDGKNRAVLERVVALRRQRLERYRALRATRDVSQQELDQVETEYLAAVRDLSADGGGSVQAPDGRVVDIEADRARAEQRYAAGRLAQLRVATPISGSVSRVHVVKGQAVFPRDPLVEITDTSSVRARGEVAPELVRYVRPGTRVEVKVFSVPPKTFVADIDRVMTVQDPAGGGRGAAVYATIANPDGALQPNTPISMTVRTVR